MKPETKKILLQYDEDQAWEFPSDFSAKDIERIERRARNVHAKLSKHFGNLTFEDWIHNQDASFGLAIIFKPCDKESSIGIEQPIIRFSNFGNLATFTKEELLPKNANQVIIDCLTQNGFIYVNAEELDERYDGIMAPNKSISSWWVRYFDWL
jgi:hypothetical protein